MPNPVTGKGKNYATNSDAAQPLSPHHFSDDDHNQLPYGKISLNCRGVPSRRMKGIHFLPQWALGVENLGGGGEGYMGGGTLFLALEGGYLRLTAYTRLMKNLPIVSIIDSCHIVPSHKTPQNVDYFLG